MNLILILPYLNKPTVASTTNLIQNDKMLRKSRSERWSSSLASLPEIDDVQQVLVLDPADGVAEGHGPGGLDAGGLPDELDDRLGNVLEAVS